jgi:hypothetical protein
VGCTPAAELRLALYRRSAHALNRFFERWTGAFCARCLDVTRRHHHGNPRADVELLDGEFPGCCHTGAGDAFWVAGSGEQGRFSAEVRRAMVCERNRLKPVPAGPAVYRVRERQTGLVARGVACSHLVSARCRLAELKGPLCLTYLCDPILGILASAAGRALVGADSDDFCGARGALLTVVSADVEQASREVSRLEARLTLLGQRLEQCDFRTGQDLYRRWEQADSEAARK